jgi:regulator of sigma E protease
MLTVLSTLFVLGILVFFHELGHFLMAKKSGIKVERFSLGFPPKLIGKKIGETEYCISWIPLGGYVKMAGENPEEQLEGKPWEFMSKPIGVRSLVILAGPLMNYLLAIFVFAGIFFFSGKQEMKDNSNVIGAIALQSPAEKAGIKSGDQIISINGIKVNDFTEMADIIYPQLEKEIKVVWIREGKEYSAGIKTFKDRVLNEKGEIEYIGKIGIGPVYVAVKDNFFQAWKDGISSVWLVTWESIKFIINLIRGAAPVKLLGGPIFIAQTAGETARLGIVSLLSFMALLSINLTIVNVLPIPMLDGGHLIFLLVEKIRRKPLSLKQRLAIQQVGLAFLFLLIVLVTYNDITRLFR